MQPTKTHGIWTPPRKLLEGKPLSTLELLRAALSLSRTRQMPLWQSLLGIGLMAWTTPTTHSTNDGVTASIWNTDLVDNLIYLHDSLPSARVYNSVNLSMTLSIDNIVTFNSERWDTDVIHDTGSNTGRLTCKTAGIYYIWGGIEWSTIPATSILSIRRNGTTTIAKQNLISTTKTMTINTPDQLAVNDYVELIVNPSATQSLLADGNFSPEFGMHRIG